MSFDLDFFKRNLTVHLDISEQFFFGQFLGEEKYFQWKTVPAKVSLRASSGSGLITGYK